MAVSDSGERAGTGASLGERARALAGRTLLSPDGGLFAQGTRFAIAGASVAAVYVGVTSLLAGILGMPFQAALAIGFAVALVAHFSLQRLFVWTHREAFALPLHGQLGRYLSLSAAQYGLTAASTALLPAVLGLSAEVVYLGTVAVVYSVNFLMFRSRIFHARRAPSG